MRSSGNKLHFYDLTQDGTKVQILAQIQCVLTPFERSDH
jgi:hypothetical protein